jgi:dynein intermediate chain
MPAGGHTYPIYSVEVIGSQKAHNVCSISNDGKLCVWNLSMLSQPYKTVELKSKHMQGPAKAVAESQNEVNVTCMAFPDDDPNNFYVGAEDGTAFWAQIHGN